METPRIIIIGLTNLQSYKAIWLHSELIQKPNMSTKEAILQSFV